jgi:type I restriction enzyme S subunit
MKRYPAYKESGIEWLGEIPLQWEMVKLRHIANLINEKAEGSSSDNNLQIALENIEGFTGRLISRGEFGGAGNRFEKGDVLFNKLRPYLCKAVIAPENGTAVGELLVLRPTNQLNNRFLLYRLLSNDFISIVDGSTYGAKMPRASWEFIGNLKIPTPSLAEQEAIADYLDHKTAAIDSLIAKKERQIELLQEQRTGVINQAVTKGLDPQVPLKENGIPWLGEIPAHWELKRLKHISPRILVGVVVNPSSYVDEKGTVPFFVGSDVSENHFSTDNVRRISRESNQKLAKSMLFAGDLVVVRVGDPGVAAVVPEHLDGSNCASMMVVGKHPSFVSEYLCFVMNSKVGKSQVEIVQYGAAQKQFNISHAIDFVYPMPPLAEQQEIANYVVEKSSKFEQAYNKIQQEIDLLREYRTAVISAAVTGKIDVCDTIILQHPRKV